MANPKSAAKLSKKDVLHVANLANLNLSDGEVKKFLPQLSKVVEFVGQLDEVDTKEVMPTSQTTGLENVQRPDEVGASVIDQSGALSGTDNIHKGYIKVKAILTERSDK